MFRFVIRAFQKLHWSVGRKISFCLLFLLLLVFINSAIVFISVQVINNSTVVERQKTQALTNIKLFNAQLQNTINIFNDSIYLATYKSLVDVRYQQEVSDALTQVKNDNPDQLKDPNSLLSQIDKSYKQLSQIFDQCNSLLQNNNSDQVTIVWASSLELRRTLQASSQQLYQIIEQEQQNAANTDDFVSLITKITVLIAGLLITLFSGLCAWLLAATIGDPLAKVHNFLESIANGDLSCELQLINRDELGELAKMLNVSVRTLRGVIESINIGTAVESVARNLRNISGEQADFSTAQVQRISEISQTLRELADTANSISSFATDVTNAADGTFAQAQAVNQTSRQMGQIMQTLQVTVSEAEDAIATANQDFISLIEQLQDVERQSQNSQKVVEITAGIAKEIHLLSLNAAIEAAGAGSYGERFKVIANQIKNLAMHSSKSTEDIANLLTHIRQAVQQTLEQSQKNQQSISIVVHVGDEASLMAKNGVLLSERNIQAVEAILQAALNSAQQANQIKMAAHQQETASQQIYTTIGAIEQVINFNAERSSEVATTSSELDTMSRRLASRLAELKITTAS